MSFFVLDEMASKTIRSNSKCKIWNVHNDPDFAEYDYDDD